MKKPDTKPVVVIAELPGSKLFEVPELRSLAAQSFRAMADLLGGGTETDEGGRPRYQWVTDATAERYRQPPDLTPWRIVFKVPTVAAEIQRGLEKGLSLATLQARVRSAVKKRHERDIEDQEGKKENVL